MNFFSKGDRRRSKYAGHNPDRPQVIDGLYAIAFAEHGDGYRHAFRDEKKGVVLYSKKADHPADPRCPGCAGA